MLTLHHLENSQSIRILWLLEELGAEYKLEHYKRVGPQTLAPEEFKKLHTIGTSPIITNGALTLPETNAIVDYILDLYPDNKLRPSVDHPQREKYLYWLHSTQASLMPLLMESLIFKRMVSKVPFFMRPPIRLVVNKVKASYLYSRYDQIMAYMDEELSKSKWLTGDDLTAADIVMSYCLLVAEARIGRIENRPHVKRLIDQIRSYPSFQSAMKKNGEFNPLSV
ncbi:glutathione S-transferase family protein [Curvivirga sp.]|uniref:glutathione S-transferase family protein n=1 Tax=Curvivirga sp. TaxID=2856848 RepID=UPI003B595849